MYKFIRIHACVYMCRYVYIYILCIYIRCVSIIPMCRVKNEFSKRLENFLKTQETYKFFLLLFLITAVCLCASRFIYYEIVYNSAHKPLEYLHQLSTSLPRVNPRKAAILIYGLQDDDHSSSSSLLLSSVDLLPPKMMDNLRKTLIDPRSFLMTSYGTHLGRSDYVDAPVYMS